MAWAWAEMDRVRSGYCGMGQPTEALRCRPPLRSLYRIMGIAIVIFPPIVSIVTINHNWSIQPKTKWQEEGGMHLVTLKGRIQSRYKLFNCLLLTSWLTSWLYFFPQKSVLFTPAITTQQQRSPKTSKDISTCKILLFKGAHWILHITNYEVQALILFLADQLFHSKTFCECIFSSRPSANKATNQL